MRGVSDTVRVTVQRVTGTLWGREGGVSRGVGGTAMPGPSPLHGSSASYAWRVCRGVGEVKWMGRWGGAQERKPPLPEPMEARCGDVGGAAWCHPSPVPTLRWWPALAPPALLSADTPTEALAHEASAWAGWG